MSASKKALVGIVVGSSSDLEVVSHVEKVLQKYGIPYLLTIASAHRTPERVRQFIHLAEKQGVKVFVAAAGRAAALPGVVASETVKPVIGIPIESRSLRGLDSLLSVVQMPAGIPVGCTAVGSGGAINAALLAVSILAVGDSALSRKLVEYRLKQSKKVVETVRAIARERRERSGAFKSIFVGK